jgi:hypothetical protein
MQLLWRTPMAAAGPGVCSKRADLFTGDFKQVKLVQSDSLAAAKGGHRRAPPPAGLTQATTTPA